jgi:hypothetical protein
VSSACCPHAYPALFPLPMQPSLNMCVDVSSREHKPAAGVCETTVLGGSGRAHVLEAH